MYLIEIAINSKFEELDYLPEYLIQKESITLTEAKNFISLIKEEKESALKKIKAAAIKKIESLKKWYKDRLAAIIKKYREPSTLKMWKDSLKKQYKAKLEKIMSDEATAGKNVWSRAGRLKSSVKAAYQTVPKSGKIGIATAGLAAAGAGGYSGYKAYKNRKAALAK